MFGRSLPVAAFLVLVGSVATGGRPQAPASNVRALETALDHVLAIGGGYLEASDAAEALAAADIVARLSGNSGEQTAYTASIDEWVESQKSPPPQQLREKARRCVTRILTEPSEMLELWQDTDEFDAWKRSVEAVLARL